MAKTSLNLDENIESLLCYVGFWITGLIFYFAEKENKTVKFHALQSILIFLPGMIIAIIFWLVGRPYAYYNSIYDWGYNPGIAPLVWLSWIIWIIMIVLMIILMVTAYQGQKIKIPIIGNIAEKKA